MEVEKISLADYEQYKTQRTSRSRRSLKGEEWTKLKQKLLKERLIEEQLLKEALNGVIRCRRCGKPLEPDARRCICGWINPLRKHGYI